MNNATVIVAENEQELEAYGELVAAIFRQFFTDIATGKLTHAEIKEFAESEWADDLLCFVTPKKESLAYVKERLQKKLKAMLL